jgi:hypothetical protein
VAWWQKTKKTCQKNQSIKNFTTFSFRIGTQYHAANSFFQKQTF